MITTSTIENKQKKSLAYKLYSALQMSKQHSMIANLLLLNAN